MQERTRKIGDGPPQTDYPPPDKDNDSFFNTSGHQWGLL